MGYGIMAYAVDFDEIRDELVGDFEGEPVPTAQRALRQLVMGEPMDDRVGFDPARTRRS